MAGWAAVSDDFLHVYRTGYGAEPDGTGINREDLTDVMAMIEPWDHILYAMIAKRRARSTRHDWPYDELPSVLYSGVVEGADFAVDAPTVPVRDFNYTQIFRYDIGITGTQLEMMDPAGIADVKSYRTTQAMRAMSKAIEARIFDIATAPTYGGAPTIGSRTVARLMRPLEDLLDATMVVDASVATLSVTHIDDAVELAFEQGVNPEFLFLNGGSKRDLSTSIGTVMGGHAGATFGGSRDIAMGERRVIRAIDVYEPELGGALAVVADRTIPKATGVETHGWAWLLEKKHLGLAVGRGVKYKELAVTGDNVKAMLLGELTLELLHPKGAAAVKEIIT